MCALPCTDGLSAQHLGDLIHPRAVVQLGDERHCPFAAITLADAKMPIREAGDVR